MLYEVITVIAEGLLVLLGQTFQEPGDDAFLPGVQVGFRLVEKILFRNNFV